jgi:hypothetical protein
MANVSQIAAVSYPAVLAEMRKPANQWSENGFLRELERQGGIKKQSLGPTIEVPVDYQVNPGAEFLATELSPVSLSKTEVITTAVFTPAELSVPVTWSKRDEATNPSENQKVALVKALLENGINSHDDRIENAFFQASAQNGFGTLLTYFGDTGQGTVGTIDSSTSTWWRHQQSTYVDDTDIESAMTTAWNNATKGSGSQVSPTLAVSDAATQALFEGTQQANQRYVDTDELKAGFKILAFKTARYVFSQYAGTRIFMFNPKIAYLVGSKEYFRDKSETMEIDNANGYSFKIYSCLQFVTSNKSRVAVVHL